MSNNPDAMIKFKMVTDMVCQSLKICIKNKHL